MGRAKGGPQASAAVAERTDRFTATLGSGRGRPEPECDTVLSTAPTGRAQEDLARLRNTLKGYQADPTRVLAALAAMAGAVPVRPLKRGLLDALAHYAAPRAASQTDFCLRTVLHDSGLRNPNRSEHVVKVSERAADDRYVHLWIEGHLYATPSDAPSVLLACGRTITGANVSLQPRGKWSAPASSRMNSDCWRCPSCADALKQARVRPRPDRIANPADLGAFSLLTASEYQLAVTRVSGETHERSRHLPALPYHLDNRRRAYLVRVLRDVFSSTLPANPDELDALSRAHALVGAISSAASEGANPSLQAGWLRHLGITVTPALAKRLPLLTAADVGDLLRGLYPPAYHAGDWRALGDREAWGAWLASADYAQACAQLPAAVRARLATRRRRGALTATSSGFPAGH